MTDMHSAMTNPLSLPRTFWVDVEDLFQYFTVNPRPNDIQRLVLETLRVLPARAALSPGAPRIVFARHSGDGALLREVPLASVVRLFDDQIQEKKMTPAAVLRPRHLGGAPLSAGRRLSLALTSSIDRMPSFVASSLLEAGVFQLSALRHARMLLSAILRPRPTAPMRGAQAVANKTQSPASDSFGGQAGDILLVLGAPWMHRDYAALLLQLRTGYEIEVALLLYDLIPVRRPEWCTASLVADFADWLASTLPLCDRLMAISHATAVDVEAYAREIGLRLGSPVKPVPIGTGFSASIPRPAVNVPQPRGLPAPGSYALFVSTLEARKNHALLFRVWRRLLAELPREQVPTLVFAGRVGWLVSDLMQQLENVNWLDGKIRLLRDPTDTELSALYRGCRFTVFPSLFEGWGVPVSESLVHGRPCISSNCTSLPEAGGDLAKYFDPENTDDAYRTIRTVIEDPVSLDAWRDRVVREFRHVSWDSTADAVLAACASAAALPVEQSS